MRRNMTDVSTSIYLMGGKRLTALWRAFHNNYQWVTYYIYIKQFDKYDNDADREDMSSFLQKSVC